MGVAHGIVGKVGRVMWRGLGHAQGLSLLYSPSLVGFRQAAAPRSPEVPGPRLIKRGAGGNAFQTMPRAAIEDEAGSKRCAHGV